MSQFYELLRAAAAKDTDNPKTCKVLVSENGTIKVYVGEKRLVAPDEGSAVAQMQRAGLRSKGIRHIYNARTRGINNFRKI